MPKVSLRLFASSPCMHTVDSFRILSEYDYSKYFPPNRRWSCVLQTTRHSPYSSYTLKYITCTLYSILWIWLDTFRLFHIRWNTFRILRIRRKNEEYTERNFHFKKCLGAVYQKNSNRGLNVGLGWPAYKLYFLVIFKKIWRICITTKKK